MPRIKRWWPCSHSFNRDPEIRELRLLYGDWMAFVWQEMCSIGDLNDGVVKGTPQQIGASLAYISLRKRPSLSAVSITNALSFMQVSGWIRIETDHVLILNHLKYHRKQEHEKVPPYLPTEPSEPIIKNNKNYSLPQSNSETEWPEDDIWLKKMISEQLIFANTNGALNDFEWWDLLATELNGLQPEFLQTEFTKMALWYREHPQRRPTAKGIKRFVRGWLERAKEQERKKYASQR